MVKQLRRFKNLRRVLSSRTVRGVRHNVESSGRQIKTSLSKIPKKSLGQLEEEE